MEAMSEHTFLFHRPPNGQRFFKELEARATHLLKVARGEDALSKDLAAFRGPGGTVKHAATLAKHGRHGVVLNTPVTAPKSPPSDTTFATPRKRR